MKKIELEKLLNNNPIEPKYQKQILEAIASELEKQYGENICDITTYVVDNTNIKNYSLDISETIYIIYVEHYRSFITFSNRTMYDVAVANDIDLTLHQPDLYLYPITCFAYTPDEIMDSLQWNIQSNADGFYDDLENMTQQEFQKTIDNALDNKDMTTLELAKGEIKKRF